ncbi:MULTISPECIES: hypothetical protein [Gardnerella]|uniref:Uncharacterized protein n=1 Tax=Gardnerella vaginalis TaxID=2702 RepID=A0A135Z654_GARVA|nr:MULTISPECIES: hypothetical protein [Gardnerella]KXI17122.1 hypothetical protein HMPREF3230_00746 [Gardnerella vaginalis]
MEDSSDNSSHSNEKLSDGSDSSVGSSTLDVPSKFNKVGNHHQII